MITTAHGLEISFHGSLNEPGHPPEGELTIYSIAVVDADEVMEHFGAPIQYDERVVIALQDDPGLTDAELRARFGEAWTEGVTYSPQEWEDLIGNLSDVEDACNAALEDEIGARIEHREGADY